MSSEYETINNEPFGRQPEKVTVTIAGDQRDLVNFRWGLKSWLENRFANVDFEMKEGEMKFLCYPFAIND